MEEVKKSEIAKKEEEILNFWKENKIFEKTLEKNAPNGNFVFYDGPPFATGLPHYGHILPGTIKDVIPRFQTMNGKRVLRRWGWDCHGLPIENLIEKELDLKSKKDIDAYGVEKFNKAARGAVFRYRDEWKKIIPRSGRWVDMDNDYRTMDSSYTESVWWSFKTLYEKELIYKDFKSILFCPHCETSLSNFEVNQGYKDITDISVYVKFVLKDEENTFVLAWTTTPWTLPGNVALAINKDAKYVKVKKEGVFLILAKDLLEKALKENFEVTEEFLGETLLGKSYTPVFDYYTQGELEHKENAWKIYHGDFVTMEDGTGVVHIAPAFGEDDFRLSKIENLPFIQHVNRDGTFKAEVVDFAGQKVKPKDDHQKADVEIIKYLAKNEVLFAKEKIIHSYPHCWRCDTPLLNYATDSWFVKVTALKGRLVELNKGVSWKPEEIGEGRFGKWLEGARDWAISRSRYWGAPLPVWESVWDGVSKHQVGERFVCGSISELRKRIKSNSNNFFVMRHGQAQCNVTEEIVLKNDRESSLTEKGIEQVKESADKFQEKFTGKIDAIYCSPYERSKQTAKIMCEKLGFDFSKVVFDERIHEWEISTEFEGKDRKIMQEYYDYEYLNTPKKEFSDGESFFDVVKRAGEFMYEVDNNHKNENILVVSHSGTARALAFVATGKAFEELKYNSSGLEPLWNAEIRKLDFVPLPHNESYELDLHRPYIDDVVVMDEEGKKELRRIPEIFDTWYDSGSMPFAQQHYPFENKEEFEREGSSIFPADFIAEGLDQTRGWFYTLLVLSVGLFDKSPYQKVLVNGLVLAEDGKKMSKKLKNYPDLMDIVNKYGADSMRYYLMASPLVKAEDFNFSEKGVDDVSKKLIQKVYNVLSFYEMYPIVIDSTPNPAVLDTWMLSRLSELNEVVSSSLNKYEIDRASRPIIDFVDDLSTWYLRRSRDRFKSEDLNEKKAASYFTRLVLEEFSKIAAPFMPFMAEDVYRRVGGEKVSVHLCDWPKAKGVDIKIIEDMKIVREVVTKALELRQKSGHKVRQPLATLSIPTELQKEYLDIIADEVNVKVVKVESGEIKLDTNLTQELKNEGIARDVIRGIQDGRKREGLNPSQNISVVVNCEENIQSVIKEFGEIIMAPTQTKKIEFTKDPQKYEFEVGESNASVTIQF